LAAVACNGKIMTHSDSGARSDDPACDGIVTFRAYAAADQEAAIELWRRTWQATYPAIDFTARLDWWRERWREELVPSSAIVVAQNANSLIGFVTVDVATGYLDQIVVAPESWGRGVAEQLVAHAKRLSPRALTLHVNQDNVRAVRFYQKHGFVAAGEDVNPRSGAAVYKMHWQAG